MTFKQLGLVMLLFVGLILLVKPALQLVETIGYKTHPEWSRK